MLYIGNKKVKVYIGDKKVKKGYIGNVLCYSSGNPVTYHVDTSTIYTEEVDDGATCLSPTTFTPAKSGYTFKGWREDSTANSSVLSSKVMGDSPITLYAVFQKNVTVTKYNGSTSATTETKQQYYNNGNVANPSFTLSQTAVSGWTVRGWSTSTTANASATVSNGGSVTLSANATYYGLYQATITLSYNGNGATSGSTAAQTGTRYWNSAGNYSNPSFTLRSCGFSRTNYSFVNWRMGSTSGTAYNAGAAITLNANTTFYASWQEIFTGYLYNRGNEYTTFTGGWNDTGTSMHGSVSESGSISKSSSYIQINVTTGSRHSKTLVTAKPINISNYSYITFVFTDKNGKTITRTTNPISSYNVSAYIFCGLDHDGNGIFYGISNNRTNVQNRCDQGYYLYNWVKDTGTGDSNYAEDHSWLRLISVKLS